MKNRMVSGRLLMLPVTVIILFLSAVTAFEAGTPYRIKTVVIDPGHGGHDAGCIGSSAREKHIVLEVALKLGKLIQTHYPDVKVVYTRTRDVFVELHQRAAIANKARADLFISIHANASESHTALGTETFVMGLHKTEENLAVARRENAVILYEKDYKNKYDGYDPNSPEAHIIFNLFQKAFMEQSLLLASKIQNEFEEYAGRFNRGVKQAGFLVLYRTAMPSVLVEIGFLTNRAEEKYLMSEKGINDIATSMFRAFRSYKIDMEGMDVAIMNDKPSVPPLKETSSGHLPDKTSTGGSPSAVIRPQPDTIGNNRTTEETLKVHAVDSLRPGKVMQHVSENRREENMPSPAAMKEEKNVSTDFFYTVQVAAVATDSQLSDERFVSAGAVAIKGDDGYTRYTIGRFKKLSDAIRMQAELRSKGFKDAFVTPYYKGKRISLKEAAALEK
jgi:N-acetylmuramoyl-L-alanine amidase